MITDDWTFKPTRILMSPEAYKDFVYGLLEEGWDAAAEQEADRRVKVMAKPQKRTHHPGRVK